MVLGFEDADENQYGNELSSWRDGLNGVEDDTVNLITQNEQK